MSLLRMEAWIFRLHYMQGTEALQVSELHLCEQELCTKQGGLYQPFLNVSLP